MRFHLSEKSESSVNGGPNVKITDDESSLERIHTFNLKAPESSKSSMVSSSAPGSIPSSPSNKSDIDDSIPQRKFKNLRTLLSLKVAASE